MYVRLIGCKTTLPVDVGGVKMFDVPTYFDEKTGRRLLAGNKGVMFECTKDGDIIGEGPKPAPVVEEAKAEAPKEDALIEAEVPVVEADTALEINTDVEFDPSTATKAELIEKCREKGISASKNDTVAELRSKLAVPTSFTKEQE